MGAALTLLELLELLICEIAELRCALDMQLPRKQARNNRKILRWALMSNLPNYISALHREIIAERLQRDLCESIAHARRTARTWRAALLERS
jgi:type II secretory pathway component PulL